MKFEWIRNRLPDGETFSFKGEIKDSDIALLNLSPFDCALLHDVGGDEKATPADLLLVLEMLFRRHQEQTKSAAEPATEKEES